MSEVLSVYPCACLSVSLSYRNHAMNNVDSKGTFVEMLYGRYVVLCGGMRWRVICSKSSALQCYATVPLVMKLCVSYVVLCGVMWKYVTCGSYVGKWEFYNCDSIGGGYHHHYHFHRSCFLPFVLDACSLFFLTTVGSLIGVVKSNSLAGP